jgi:hypothetical protein
MESDMNDLARRLRDSDQIDVFGLRLEAADEIERLQADKAAISQTASDYLHEILRLKAVVRHQSGVELSEENDRLIEENKRLHAVLLRLSEDVAFTPMRATDMDELKARLRFVREALALMQTLKILEA